ncbi:hypothetical protein ROZALSC1DRAFT_25851, partial [Rozella allomycis CSF55]
MKIVFLISIASVYCSLTTDVRSKASKIQYRIVENSEILFESFINSFNELIDTNNNFKLHTLNYLPKPVDKVTFSQFQSYININKPDRAEILTVWKFNIDSEDFLTVPKHDKGQSFDILERASYILVDKRGVEASIRSIHDAAAPYLDFHIDQTEPYVWSYIFAMHIVSISGIITFCALKDLVVIERKGISRRKKYAIFGLLSIFVAAIVFAVWYFPVTSARESRINEQQKI